MEFLIVTENSAGSFCVFMHSSLPARNASVRNDNVGCRVNSKSERISAYKGNQNGKLASEKELMEKKVRNKICADRRTSVTHGYPFKAESKAARCFTCLSAQYNDLASQTTATMEAEKTLIIFLFSLLHFTATVRRGNEKHN